MKITEKMLEDWICENPQTLPWSNMQIIDRQVVLENGILDVLGWDGRTVVMELKARPIKERDIGQILRYRNDAKRELQRIGYVEAPYDPHCEVLTFRKMAYAHLWDEHHGHAENGIRGIQSVLIGKSVDRKTWIAAYEADIMVWTWEYIEAEQQFSFKPTHHEFNFSEPDYYPSWLLSIHQLIKKVLVPDTERVFMQNIADLFGLVYKE